MSVDIEKLKEEGEKFSLMVEKLGLYKAYCVSFEEARKSGKIGLVDTNNNYERELEQERVRFLTKLHKENLRKKEQEKNDE